MHLSTVIVSWNTRELLASCLDSLQLATSGVESEIWVVDNASSDGTADFVEQAFPDVELIRSSSNLGFARANNLAIPRTSGRYLLLLNPDTELEAGSLNHMLKHMNAHSGAGAVGPMLVDLANEMQQSAEPAPSLMSELSRLFHLFTLLPTTTYDMKKWDLDRPREVDVLQGACLMIRSDALRQVGVLDEDYFMYSEEVDLCYRLRNAGWTIHWLPQAKVIHHEGQSAKQIPMESFINLYKGKVTYFRKNHGMASALAYKLILAAASVARLLISPLAFLQQRDHRKHNLELAGRYRKLLTKMPSL